MELLASRLGETGVATSGLGSVVLWLGESGIIAMTSYYFWFLVKSSKSFRRDIRSILGFCGCK